MDVWSGSVATLIALVTIAMLVVGREWGRYAWRAPVFAAGAAIAVVALLPPIDRAANDGLLQAHVVQHIVLGDLAAPLLLIGLPRSIGRWLGLRLDALALVGGPARRGFVRLVGPLGAFICWTLATYAWFVPALHRQATPPGPAHALDHASFLLFGILIWLGAFDVRRRRPGSGGLRVGGMPWLGRHVYAMATRLVITPLAVVVWFGSPAAFHETEALWPFAASQADDQTRAGTLMVGFEMVLFALAMLLLLLFVQISEGQRRALPDYEP